MREYCSNCNKVVNAYIMDSGIDIIPIESIYCESCNSFILARPKETYTGIDLVKEKIKKDSKPLAK